MAGFQRAALLICRWIVRRRPLGAFFIAVPARTLTMVARRGTPVHQWLGNRRQTVEPWSWTPCISLEKAEKLSSELRVGNGSTLGGRKNRAAHPVVFKGVASLLLIFWSKVRILHGPPMQSMTQVIQKGTAQRCLLCCCPQNAYFALAPRARAASRSAAACAATAAALAAAFAERSAVARSASNRACRWAL